MKILKQEVKTTYTIALTAMDLGKMVENFREDENSIIKIMHPDAFDFVPEELTMENVRTALKTMQFSKGKGTCDFIAKYLEFDGWENAGYFNEANEEYRMVVYTYGDRM